MEKKLLFAIFCCFYVMQYGVAQCNYSLSAGQGTAPNCNNALDISPYVANSSCETLCYTTTGGSDTHNSECATGDNSIWLTYFIDNTTNIGDGSFAISFSDFPGATAPVVATYAEADGIFDLSGFGLGTVNLSIDCTSGTGNTLVDALLTPPWLLDGADITIPGSPPISGAPCFQNDNGNQTFFDQSVLVTPADIKALLDGATGASNTINSVQIWLQIEASATGEVCFEISDYESGFTCGDPTLVNFDAATNLGTETQTVSNCLCTTAVSGSLSATAPSGSASGQCPAGNADNSAAWYQINADYSCNTIQVDLTAWAGAGDVTIDIISNLNCPDYPSEDLLGNPITVSGGEVSAYTEEGSGCVNTGGSVISNNLCLPPGDYWIVVSGADDRDDFTIDITISEPCLDITALSLDGTGEVCSDGSTTITATTEANVEFIYFPTGTAVDATVAYAFAANGGASLGTANTNGTLASGSGGPFPQNATCDPVAYDVYAVVAPTPGDPSCRPFFGPTTATVYPEIGPSTITVGSCEITVEASCPNFTVNGNPAADTNATYLPGDNGTPASFVVSNGLTACNVIESPAITCQGNCAPPTVTATPQCLPDNSGYEIIIEFTDFGDSPTYTIEQTDGTTVTADNATTTYTLGTFANNASVGIKILNDFDPNCNVNLGTFTLNCIACPSITSINGLNSPACENEVIALVANVDAGTEGVDYAIQWQANGVDIIGANTAVYNYTADATGCDANNVIFTANLICLNNGDDSAMPVMNSNAVDIYPIPEFGIDFGVAQCSATPFDNCGSLVIDNGGAADPTAGSETTVNYTVSVAGAPVACSATGTYTVGCPVCIDSPGDATTTATSVCWNESFDISNAFDNLQSEGYEVGLAVSTSPLTTTINSTADLTAFADIGIFGPYNTIPGSINPAEMFTNDGAAFPAPTATCGETYYFTPFLSFNTNDPALITSFNYSSGAITVPELEINGFSVDQIIPGTVVDGVSIDGLVYCEGLTTYDIQLCVTDEDDSFATECDLFATSAGVDFGFLGTINLSDVPAGITSGFPNLNGDGPSEATTQCYNQNTYTLDPNQDITIAAFNACNTLAVPSGDSDFSYFVTATLTNTFAFPTICPSCNSVGQSVAVTIYPEVLSAPALPAPALTPDLCEGDVVDLTQFAPAYNLTGTTEWFDGASVNGLNIVDPTSVVPTDGQSFCAVFTACEANPCSEEQCILFTVNPLPVLTAPVPDLFCPGETYDLTTLETQVTANVGAIAWYLGDPVNNGAEITAQPVTPVGSELYYAEFTDGATGCVASVSFSFAYHPVPVLSAVAPQLCEGESIDLATLEASITANAGTFEWFDANPNPYPPIVAGNLITNLVVTPSDGDEVFVTFTDETTGCASTTNVVLTVTDAPILIAPTAELCEGDTLNLVLLEPIVTTDAGVFTWSLGMVDIGFPVVDATMVIPNTGDEYCVTFVDNATTCYNEICFTPTVNPLPIFTDYAPPALCAGATSVDLTSVDYEGTLGSDTFTWYDADPATGAASIADATAAPTPDGTTTTFWFVLTSTAGCTDTSSIDIEVYSPIENAVVAYDCDANQITVDVTAATGGSGTGYAVAATSPNNAGDVIADDATWTVIIEDSNGCQITFTDTNLCNACQATAPTVTGNGNDCGDGSLGAPIILVDDANGSANAGEITEYILTTQPNDTIRLVGTLAAVQAALDAAETDSTMCIQAITHTQAEIDQIIADLDICVGGLGLSIYTLLGLPTNNNTLEGILDGIGGVAAGTNFTIADIENLIGGSGGGPGFGGSVDVGELLGLPAGTLVCNVAPFCYNISTQTCVTVGNCGCNAAAPTLAIVGNDCGAGSTAAPFIFTDNADGSTTTGEITEYIITSAPNDTIRFVGDAAGIEATLNGLPVDSTVCVQAITHLQAELDSIVNDLDICTGGLATGVLGLSLTGNTLESILTAIGNFAAGTNFTIADIESLIGGSGGGPGIGGSVDVGELLGLPPGTLVCDIRPFCYSIGSQTCVTTGACSPCPTVTNITTPSELCSDATTQVCFDFDSTVDASISITVDEVVADGSAGGTQICANVTAPSNQTCGPNPYDFTLAADCGGAALDISGFILVSTQIYPELPTASITNVVNACSEATAVVTVDLLAADGVSVCDTQTFNAAANETCTAVDESFSYAWSVADIEALLGGTGLSCYADVSGIETVSIFPAQPTIEVYAPVSACSTVGSQFSADLTIGVNVCDTKLLDIPLNEGCNENSETINIEWTATEIEGVLEGVGCYADVSESATFDVYPSEYTLSIVNPDCVGGAGSATILAVDGTPCETQTGTTGTLNVCPATTGTDAILDYDFATLNNTCLAEPTDTIIINCNQPCNCPADPDLAVSANAVCSSSDVSFTAQFLGGTGTGTLSITESTGTITGIPTDGTPVTLPANTTCNPVIYTFDLTAVCNDGSPIPGGVGTIQQMVTVYPTNVDAFITNAGDNTCTTSVTIDASCDGTLAVDQTTQTANAGDGTGNHTYNFTYSAGGFGETCIAAFTVDIPFDCPVVEECGTVNAGSIADIILCDQAGGVNPTAGQFMSDGDAGGTWTIDGGASIDATGNVDASGLTAGTHNVTYTVINPDLADGTVCEDATATALLTVEDCTPPEECGTVNAGSIADIILCDQAGGVNPTAGQFMSDGDAGGTWTIDGGASIDATGNVDASGLTAGTYNVTYTVVNPDLADGTVCDDGIASAVLTVEDCTPPVECGTVNAGSIADIILCDQAGGANPTVGQFMSDGDAGGTWTIDGGASIDAMGNVDASGLTAGTYNVTYAVVNPDLADGTVCEDATATALLIVENCTPPEECGTVNAGSISDIILCDQAGGVNPTAGQFMSDGDAGGTWTIDGGASIDAIGNVDASGLVAGTYNVTYTVVNPDLADGTVCDDAEATAVLTVEDCTPPEECGTVNAGSIADITLCDQAGGVNPTAGQFMSDGDVGGTWTIDGGASIDAMGNVDASGLAAGTYNVTYTIVNPDLADGTVCEDATATVVLTVEDCTPDVLGSIGNTVFDDSNKNGVQDAGENGISGIIITITYPDGTTATTTTGTNGSYIFDDLPAGEYTVTVGDGGTGMELTTTNTFTITLAEGEDYMDAIFGFGAEEVECVAPTASFETVCNDDGTFSVQVSVTDLGNSTTIVILDNSSTTPSIINNTGTYLYGNYADDSIIELTVAGSASNDCLVVSGELTDDCVEEPCDINISVNQDCNGVTSEQTNVYVITGGSGNYIVSGDFDGVIGSEPIVVTYDEGEITDITAVDSEDLNCTDSYVEIINCVVGECNWTTDLKLDCVEETGTANIVVTIVDGSGNYEYTTSQGGVPTSLAGSVEAAFQVGPYTDGETYYISVTDLDNGCNVVYSNQIECTKTAVELLRFAGEVLDNGNSIIWTTATETDNDYFTLERSRDGVNFEAITTINGAGNSITPNSYSFIDNDVLVGDYYYRLSDTDYNGSTNIISEVIKLSRNTSFGDLEVSPIPTVDNLNIEFVNYIGSTTMNLKIYDVTGKVVSEVALDTEAGLNTEQLNVSDYANGTYFIALTNSNEVITAKFVKH